VSIQPEHLVNANGQNGHPAPAPDSNGTGSSPPLPNGGNGNGRTTNGRFAKGNKGGPGNPFARKVAALRSALLDAVTPTTVKRIAKQLASMAEEGDLDAAKLLLSYTIGKPTEAADPDDLPRAEWERLTRFGRTQAIDILRLSLDPHQALEAMAALLGYPSEEQFRKALFARVDPALIAQLSAALMDSDEARRTRPLIGPDSARTWKFVVARLLLMAHSQKDTLSAEKALETPGVCRDLLGRLEAEEITFAKDLPYMAGRLRFLIERARPAAKTPEAVALLDDLERQAKAGEAKAGESVKQEEAEDEDEELSEDERREAAGLLALLAEGTGKSPEEVLARLRQQA